jgi:hypothetical protein
MNEFSISLPNKRLSIAVYIVTTSDLDPLLSNFKPRLHMYLSSPSGYCLTHLSNVPVSCILQTCGALDFFES